MTMISDKAKRAERYRPRESDEDFLRALNQRLAESPQIDAVPDRPTLFVAGGPRSGTTFLAQCLCQALDVAYIDNLAAGFWRAPVTGYRLSRLVLGRERRSTFESEYGRTNGADIHGFHYFWMEQLQLAEPATLFSNPDARGVCAAAINGHLAALQDIAEAPFVFKGYYPSYFMPWFAAHVPNSVFVLIRRDPLTQARSIYRARQAYMQSVDDWWSMLPPEHEQLISLSAEQQIAGQIFGLRRMYAHQMQGHTLPVVVVNYEDLTSDVMGIINRVVRSVEQITDHRLQTTGVMPEVRAEGNRVSEEIEDRLVDAVKCYASWDEPWETPHQ